MMECFARIVKAANYFRKISILDYKQGFDYASEYY